MPPQSTPPVSQASLPMHVMSQRVAIVQSMRPVLHADSVSVEVQVTWQGRPGGQVAPVVLHSPGPQSMTQVPSAGRQPPLHSGGHPGGTSGVVAASGGSASSGAPSGRGRASGPGPASSTGACGGGGGGPGGAAGRGGTPAGST